MKFPLNIHRQQIVAYNWYLHNWQTTKLEEKIWKLKIGTQVDNDKHMPSLTQQIMNYFMIMKIIPKRKQWIRLTLYRKLNLAKVNSQYFKCVSFKASGIHKNDYSLSIGQIQYCLTLMINYILAIKGVKKCRNARFYLQHLVC